MSLESVPAILLKRFPYGESGFVLKALTNEGLRSFFIQGIRRKSKKSGASILLPLNLVEITYYPARKGDLHRISDIKAESGVGVMYDWPTNLFVVQFMGDMLYNTVLDSDSHPELFKYVSNTVMKLALDESHPNLPIEFAIELCRHLGFHPSLLNKGSYFDLQEGLFVSAESATTLSVEHSNILRSVLEKQEVKLNGDDRSAFLSAFLRYYELHLPGFKYPESLEILNEVLHR